MVRGIGINHGTTIIIIRVRSPGVSEFTGIHIQAGDFPLVLAMDGLDGVFIRTEGHIGAQEATIVDTATGIIGATDMAITEDTQGVRKLVMQQDQETQMFIITGRMV